MKSASAPGRDGHDRRRLRQGFAAVVKAAIALPPAAGASAGAQADVARRPRYRPMSRSTMTTKRYLLLTAMMTAAVSVAGCSTISKINPFDKKEENKTLATQGQRISVIAFDQKVEQAEALKGATSSCPSRPSRPTGRCRAATPSSRSSTWRRRQFRHRLAQGLRPEGQPQVSRHRAAGGRRRQDLRDGRRGDRRRHRRQDGSTIWRKDLRPAKAGPGKKRGFMGIGGSAGDRTGFGGGVAYANGKLYVASGFRFVAQLDAATGAEAWRQQTSTPVHAAPTVADGRVFVISTDNELLTFNAADGAPGWTYQALIEPARILGATSPAVSGDTVVAGFASGELVALRATNGNDLWSEALSRASRTNALSEIRDIAGRPVIFKGDVFAVSHSGVFAATDLRTGQARWSLPVTAITSPWAAGDVVFVVDKAGQVICVSRESRSGLLDPRPQQHRAS
jgi:outer membrane protein assembly factor BamB